MLLRDIQLVLVKHDNVGIQATHLPGDYFNYIERDALRQALEDLAQVPTLRELSLGALLSPLFQGQSSVIPKDEHGQMTGSIRALQRTAQTLRLFLDQVLPPIPERFFAVTFQEGEDIDTDSAASRLNDFFAALDRPCRLFGNEPLRISAGQPGSLWLEIVGSATALGIVGEILKRATAWQKYRKAKAEADEAEALANERVATAANEKDRARYNAMRAKALAARAILDLQKEVMDADDRTTFVDMDASEDISEETVTTLMVATRHAEDLLNNGMVVRLPVSATADVLTQFPPSMHPARPLTGLPSPSTPKMLGQAKSNDTE